MPYRAPSAFLGALGGELHVVFFKSLGAQENHDATHASDYSIDRELPPIDLNLVAGIYNTQLTLAWRGTYL